MPSARPLRRPRGLANRLARGVSLVETAIVVAIGAIVLTSAAPGVQATLARRHLDGVALQLAGDWQFARTEAVARNEPVRMSFHADADASCWVVHTHGRALCSCEAGHAVCGGGAALIRSAAVTAERRVAVDANVGSILYDPVHGTSTPTGTLRVIGAAAEVRHIVNVLGRVRSCSPQGAASGWRAC